MNPRSSDGSPRACSATGSPIKGDGLHAIVRHLRGCLATFTTELARDGSPLEAIRRSDLLIVHHA